MTQPKINQTTLKKHLKTRSQAELIADIAELYKRFQPVKDYYQIQLYPQDEKKVAAKYKKIIEDEFFPARGYGKAKLSVAKKSITEYKKADAVRGRIDWKYALCLPLEDSGFDFSTLSEFRKRLIEGGSEELLLNRILKQLREKGLIKGHKRQRTDSTHILAAIRPLNRLETLGETMRAALNSLAVAAPLRVSTNQQDVDNQRHGILEYANRKSFGHLEFVEDTVSGQKRWRDRELGQLSG